jgi:hypothetical protein
MIVRATSSVSTEIMQYVAQVFVPGKKQIPANESAIKFIRQVCGVYTVAYGEVFKKANEAGGGDEFALGARPFPRDVVVPACIYWRLLILEEGGNRRPGVDVPVQPGDHSLDALLARYVGANVKGDTVYKCAPGGSDWRCNRTFRTLVQGLNPGRSLDDLQAAQQRTPQQAAGPGPNLAPVRLPIVTRPTPLKLKRGEQADAVKAKIKELANYGAEFEINTEQHDIRLLGAVDASVLSDKDKRGCTASALASRQDWPYDAKLVRSVIEGTAKIAQEKGMPRDRIIVTVIDTGLEDTRLAGADMTYFFNSKSTDPRNSRFGRGVSNQSDTRPDQGYPDAWHGTVVTDLVIGGSGLRKDFTQLSNYLSVSVVKLMHRTETRFEIRNGSMENGLVFAAAIGASVANVSIGSSTRLSVLDTFVRTNPRLLIVAAAGNDNRRDIGPDAVYPARSASESDQIISVAAHDANNAITEFSNFSNKHVDLAAPGCSVRHAVEPTNGGAAHGTSFAAPLVTMTVALLRSFGVQPPEVKMRLRASVDFDPALEDYVAWSGRLNIAKALAVYQDVLEMRVAPGEPRKLVFGDWKPDADPVRLCEQGPLQDAELIRKIVVSASSPPMIRVLRQEKATEAGERPALLLDKECRPASEGLKFTDTTRPGAQEVLVPWAQIVDLVPRRWRDSDLGGEGQGPQQ